MNTNEQVSSLTNKLYSIADTLRGNMDAVKFKDYMLSFIFYNYLSDKTEKTAAEILINEPEPLTYEEAYNHPDYHDFITAELQKRIGYYIEPKHLFKNIIYKIACQKFGMDTLSDAFEQFEKSLDNDSNVFDNIFSEVNLTSNDLGTTDLERTNLISQVLLAINDININDYSFDILGTAYMFLISKFAGDAGKKTGEFFTPISLATLTAKLATYGVEKIYDIYDPCAGSGSMLLNATKDLDFPYTMYYGQEKNATTYNLFRMNLIMHGISFDKFRAANADTLTDDKFKDNKFQIQVSNPPYSLKHTLTESDIAKDPRFDKTAAKPSKADMLFLEHIIYHMKEDGRAAVLLPHGILFREGQEKKIREYILSLGCLDAIIGLPAKLFHTTGIPVVCLVLDKKKTSDDILFIDASQYYVKGKKTNTLADEDINRILDAYGQKKDIERFCRMVSLEEIKENDYNLNIPRYVDSREPEPEIDLTQVHDNLQRINKEIEEISLQLKDSFEALGLVFPL